MDNSKPSLREIFADAAEIADPARRAAFLDEACGEDWTLRKRVEQLLAAHAGAGKFLPASGDTTTTTVVAEKPGDRIGRYRLIERIGRGGGGVVYLAEQEEPVRRRVALKILKLGMDTQSVVARFEAERQALALMDHPNIARVLDAGATETGRPFFVMELVRGLRIAEYCERHQLPLPQRLELFIAVCQAVQHAHQKGIIHRELKPSNILVTEHEGVAMPKVIDFGIAKAIEPGPDGAGSLTSVDQFLGTPAYMSPEQVQFGGRDLDTRTDIYSLGVILYELLAGQPPFDPKQLAGASFEEMRRIIREVDPPRPSTTITRNNLNLASLSARRSPRERLAAVRGDLDWIVMKCLEKDRTRRYETANGLAMDLRRHLDNEPVVARPPTQFYRLTKVVRRHRLLFGAAGIIAVVLIVAVVISAQLALRATRAEREQGRLHALAETKATESRQRLVRRYVAEGNRLMEQNRPVAALPWMVEALELEAGDAQREADERLRIGQAMVGAPELRLHLAQGKWVNTVALSPDGTLLATGGDDGFARITEVASGGEIFRELGLAGAVGRVSFSADGTRVVAVDTRGRARVWNAHTGEALTPLLVADDFDPKSIAGTGDWLKPAASFSPDGKLLLLAWGSPSAQLRDGFNGQLLRLLRHGDVVYHAAFSPDGRQLVTCSKDGTARVWDVATGNAAGPPLEHRGIVTWAQFSSQGDKLLTVRERHFVQLWDWREGRRLAPEIPRRSVLFHASLSPNGSNILTTAWSGYAHLYEAASSRLVYQFQQHGGLVDAGFSPDGRHLATACDDGNVWVWNVGDMAAPPMMLPQGNHIEEIAFSRDGRRLAVGGRGGHARVWDLFPRERGVRRLPGNDVRWVEFDGTGRRALVLSTGSESRLNVYNTQDGHQVSEARFEPRQATCARFSPDGRQVLAFGSGPAVFVLDSDTGREVFPPLAHEDRVRQALWSPDGKLIITAAGIGGARAWESATGKIVTRFPNSNSVNCIAISPDGKRLATGHQDHSVLIWETRSGQPAGAGSSECEDVRQIAFSPDGRFLVISGTRGTEGILEVRDSRSGELVRQPLVLRDSISSFELSRDGRWVATACEDHSARVWEVVTGGPLSPWLPHDFEARQVVFSPDGSRLATLARRGAIRLWNARTGEPITAPIVYPRNVGDGCVSYSPDGKRLLLARGGNEAWLRELQPETASLDQLRLLGQVLSCTGFDPAAGMVPLDESTLKDAWDRLQALRRNEPKPLDPTGN